MDTRDRQDDPKRNASSRLDEHQDSQRTSGDEDRDDLARIRERRNNPRALTRREREERWPIG